MLCDIFLLMLSLYKTMHNEKYISCIMTIFIFHYTSFYIMKNKYCHCTSSHIM